MNERKTIMAGLGLSLLVAAGSVLAADPPGAKPASTEAGKKGDDAAMLACTKAELDIAQKAGKNADACKADKARAASGGGGGTGKGSTVAEPVFMNKAAPPAKF